MIHIVGLGATDEKDLTKGAMEVIHNGRPHFLRTRFHKAVSYFEREGISYTSFDDYYEKENTFESVYEEIVDRLISEEQKEGEINYYVPGNPYVAESTVQLLQNRGVEIEIYAGMSFIEPVLASVGRDAVKGLKFLDYDFEMEDCNLSCDLLITQVYNSRIASDIAIKLSQVYGDEYDIHLITDAGLDTEMHCIMPIYKLSRYKNFNHQTAIYVPQSNQMDINCMMGEMRKLIEKKGIAYGNQFVSTLKEKLKCHLDQLDCEHDEEVFEVFSLIFFALISAQEQGFYTFQEVIPKLWKKIVENSDFFVNNVEKFKELGYNCSSLTNNPAAGKDEPCSFYQAMEIIDEAIEAGFMWTNFQDIKAKVLEELEEVQSEINLKNSEHLMMEIGDVLFTCVNLARFVQIDANKALAISTEKFIRRWNRMQEITRQRNLNVKDLTLGELDQIYNETKKNLNFFKEDIE